MSKESKEKYIYEEIIKFQHDKEVEAEVKKDRKLSSAKFTFCQISFLGLSFLRQLILHPNNHEIYEYRIANISDILQLVELMSESKD
jgi:hypothetical protein